MASGEFIAIAGAAVSGTVTVYDMSDGAYIVRLAGLVAPAETGMTVIPVVDGSSVASLALRANTGTQNYTIQTTVSSPGWDKVRLHSSATNRDYAEALFTR